MLPVDRASAEQLRLGSDTLTVLATSAETAGAIFAVEIRMPPGGGLPLLHRHAPSEIYHVLEGEFVFHLDRGAGIERVVAGPGDVVPLTGGTPHTIRNESEHDAVAFVVHSPGTAMDEFAHAGAALAAAGDPAIDDMLALAAHHGVEILGPVPQEA